jgi:hypothetical protein
MKYQTFLSYDQETDRLIDGEQFKRMKDRLIKSSLMPMNRAQQLIEDSRKFASAYENYFGNDEPYPITLFLFQLNEFQVNNSSGQQVPISIPELFSIDTLSMAPPDYFELGQLGCVVPGPGLTNQSKNSYSSEAIQSFAKQLFKLIKCAHRYCNSTLSSRSGSCLAPAYITTSGACSDFYFLTSLEKSSRELISRLIISDLEQGFSLIANLADKKSDVEAGLTEAITCYNDGQKLNDHSKELISNMPEEAPYSYLKNLAEATTRG